MLYLLLSLEQMTSLRHHTVYKIPITPVICLVVPSQVSGTNPLNDPQDPKT